MTGPRFVVQEHTTPEGVHWDFMIEREGVLATFRLEQPPQAVLDHAVRAVQIFDHPLRFLTYEGPVQKGAGRVSLVDRGTCHGSDEKDGPITLDLRGEILRGRFTLTRIDGPHWELKSAD
jgi:bifunctional non-homologous end joining protein LigD